jgi:hypothetical protein
MHSKYSACNYYRNCLNTKIRNVYASKAIMAILFYLKGMLAALRNIGLLV